MANRRFIDFPIASTSGDTDIILIWQDGVNKQTTKATILSGLPENLDELNDVAISGLTNGQILRYDSVTGKWENTDQGNLDLNDLNDVSIVSPSNGQVLVYNSSTSKWENSSAGFVPYVGAVTTVDLGSQGLRAGYVRFDTSVVSVPDEQGLMYWDSSKSTVALIMNGTLQHIGQDTFFYCKNSTGSSIPKGTSVRFAGTDGASGHILITPFLANGSVPSNYFVGVTAEVIANGAFGQVMHFGELTGINTSSYSSGALLYASTTVAGAFQTTVPVAPNNIVLVAAAVNSKNNGAIVVRPTYGSNINTDEGVKITSGATGDLLQLQAGGLWENKTIDGAGIVTKATAQSITGTKTFGNSNLILASAFNANPTYLTNSGGSSSYQSGYNLFGFNTDNHLYFAKSSNTGANTGILAWSNTATRTYTLKDASGTLAFTSDIPSLSGYVQGSGTTNYVSKFTGSGTIGNSQIFDNGTVVGIATTALVADALLPIQINAGASGQAYFASNNNGGYGLLIGYDNANGYARIRNVSNTALTFETNNSEKMRLTNSGNLGLGVTPSAWGTDFKALQIGASGGTSIASDDWNGFTEILNNVFASARNTYTRIQSLGASRYSQQFGNHVWYSVGAGSGGTTVSFTPAMTLTNANLLVGTTTDNGARLQVSGSGAAVSILNASDIWYNVTRGSSFTNIGVDSTGSFYNTNTNHRFLTNSGSTTAVTITSSGNVGIGPSSPQVRLDFGNSLDQAFHLYSSGSDYYGINMRQYDSGPYSTNIFSGDGGQIKFRTASGTTTQSTRMTITSGGNVLIGTTTDAGNGILQVNKSSTNAVARFINPRNVSGDFSLVTELGSNCNNTSSYHYIAATAGADKFYLYGNGTYATVSDIRLKKNIASVTEQFLEKVLALDIVTYNWNDQKDGSDLELGMIAQQVETAFPSIVKTNRPDLSGQTYKAIQASSLPYILIKAIQELKQEIDTLKN